jgi:hypothetical protein
VADRQAAAVLGAMNGFDRIAAAVEDDMHTHYANGERTDDLDRIHQVLHSPEFQERVVTLLIEGGTESDVKAVYVEVAKAMGYCALHGNGRGARWSSRASRAGIVGCQ